MVEVESITVGRGTLVPSLRTFAWNGAAMHLSKLECGILHKLMSEPDQGHLLEAMAGDLGVQPNTIKVTIHRLRRRVRSVDPQFDPITSRTGRNSPGYTWERSRS